jgi:hypothetical protein
VAVTVTSTVPVVALEEARNDTVTVQVALQGLFVKLGVTPVGKDFAEKVTRLGEPLINVAVIDDSELVWPWTTVRLFGLGVDRLKSKVDDIPTVTDPVRHWLAVVVQSTTAEPSGALTEEATKVTLVTPLAMAL